MGFVLKKIALEDFLTKTTLYSKQIRGNLDFTLKTRTIEKGHRLELQFTRDHDNMEPFLNKAAEVGFLTTQQEKRTIESAVLRLWVNDKDFMITSNGPFTMTVEEQNFNPKEIEIIDFPKGKVSIKITLDFEIESDNTKLKKELKESNMEETDETTSNEQAVSVEEFLSRPVSNTEEPLFEWD